VFAIRRITCWVLRSFTHEKSHPDKDGFSYTSVYQFFISSLPERQQREQLVRGTENNLRSPFQHCRKT
jgi:hypothetical protein